MSDSTPSPRSEVVLVEGDSYLEHLADFVGRVWTPGIRPEELAASRQAAARVNPASPGVAPPTYLFLLEGRAVGHLTTIPTRLQIEGWSGPAHWLKGFWVLPDHRNGPIGAMLVKAAARDLDALLATVVESAPRRVFGAFKMRDLGVLSEHVRLLRPHRVLTQLDPAQLPMSGNAALRAVYGVARQPGLAQLSGAILRGALSLRAAFSRGARDVRVADEISSEAGLDALWARVAAGLTCTPVRDAAYLNRTYQGARGSRSSLLVLSRAGETVGWASLRKGREQGDDPRFGGVRIATLSDVVVPPDRPEDGIALLREAEHLAREQGDDILLCSASHPSLRRWLAARAFVPLTGRLHLAARAPANGPELPDSLDRWWLTRADGGADGGL